MKTLKTHARCVDIGLPEAISPTGMQSPISCATVCSVFIEIKSFPDQCVDTQTNGTGNQRNWII